jgi:hypothetical protein
MPLKTISDFISCLFYIRYCTSKTPTEAFKSAVIMGDVNGFDYLLRTYHKNTTDAIIKYYAEEFLITSYYNSYLSMAERLIKAGAKLKGDYIAHIKYLPNIRITQEHLNNIEGNVDNKTFTDLNQIITAHYSSAISTEYNKKCIDFEEVLLGITYTNDKNSILILKLFIQSYINIIILLLEA